MNFETVTIENKEQLFQHLMSYESHWMFRGHTFEAWALESALERLLTSTGWTPELAEKCEKFSLTKFCSNAHLYQSKETLPTSTLGWLSLMQHHGVPTRLLDFTLSPFIALFFALDAVNPDRKEGCAIWALDYRALTKGALEYIRKQEPNFKYSYNDIQTQQDEVFETVINNNSYDVLWITEPGILNLRLERQKGTFLISGNIGKRITDLLPLFTTSESLKKIIIPAFLSVDAFQILDKVGLSHSRLFSDIDGLGRDIKNEILHQVTYKRR